MALVAHNGLPLRSPSIADIASRWNYATNDPVTIDASTEKVAFIGWPWFPGYGTKSIRSILFRVQTVSVNAASQIRISLQDIDTATGTPPQPDGSVDQSVTLAGTAFSSNTNISSGNLDADRSVTWGSGNPICVVFEYTTFTAADSIIIYCNRRTETGGSIGALPMSSFYNGTSWAQQTGFPNIGLVASDGTVGCLFNAPMIVGGATQSYSSGEWGLKFQVAEPCSIVGANVFHGTNVDGRDAALVLYDGSNNVLASTDLLGEWQNSTAALWIDMPLAAYDLSASTTYYLAMKQTAGAGRQLGYFDLYSADHVVPWGYGTGSCIVTRATAGSGAWTEDTDRLPMIFPYFGKFSDGSGSGGGGPLIGGRLVRV